MAEVIKAIFQLFIYRDASTLLDIIETEKAKDLIRQLEEYGFDHPIPRGWEAFAELHMIPTTSDGGGDINAQPLGKWTITAGAVPQGCRKPRPCITVDGKVHDLEAFVAGLLDGSIAPTVK